MEYPSDIKTVSADGFPSNLCVTLDIGQHDTIDFIERSTSGYQWVCISSCFSEIELDDCRLVGTIPGEASRHRFRITALKAGSHNMVFQLARPWKINENIATVSILVTVIS